MSNNQVTTKKKRAVLLVNTTYLNKGTKVTVFDQYINKHCVSKSRLQYTTYNGFNEKTTVNTSNLKFI